MLRCTVALLGALVLLGLVRAAAAQGEHRVSLQYVVDSSLEGCPTRFEFENSVSRQLGYDPFRDEAPYRVVISASGTATGMSGSVLWSDANRQPQGEREFAADDRDCGKLARSMAFSMVVQLQLLDAAPAAVVVAAPADEQPPAEAPAASTVRTAPSYREASSSVDTADQPPHDASEPIRPRSLRVGLGPLVSTGLAPQWNVLGRVFAAVDFEVVSLELGGVASLPATWRAPDGSGFRSYVLMATLSPCLLHERFSSCAITQLGQIAVEGTGVDEPLTPSAFVAQAGLRFRFATEWGPVVTGVHVDALQTFRQWTVELNDTEVWTMPGTTLQLGIDVELPLRLHR